MTGPDAIAAMEARLLAVERRCVRLEDDTRTLAHGLGLAQQRTWESWTDFRARPPVAIAAGHPLSGICGGISLPDSIPFTDTFMSVSDTLDWDGSSAWIKCVSGITWPGTARLIAIHYRLSRSTSGSPTVNLDASWLGDANGRPPTTGSTCADAPNFANVVFSPNVETCPPTTYQKTFIVTGATSLFLRNLYQFVATTRTITVGPVAPA